MFFLSSFCACRVRHRIHLGPAEEPHLYPNLSPESKWERERDWQSPWQPLDSQYSNISVWKKVKCMCGCVCAEQCTWREIWRCCEWRTGRRYGSCSSCLDAVNSYWGSHRGTWWMTTNGQTHHTHTHTHTSIHIRTHVMCMYICIYHRETQIPQWAQYSIYRYVKQFMHCHTLFNIYSN